MKITIIGAGNIGGAIARGLAKGHMFKASDITCTAQSDTTLEKMRNTNPDFVLSLDNVEAVKGADIIVIAVKPWRVEEIIDQIKGILDYDKQIIVSVAAGITFDLLNTYLTKNTGFDDCLTTPTIFRIMPNTAIEVLSSMTFVAVCRNRFGFQRDRIRLALYPRSHRRRCRIRFLPEAGTGNRCPYGERSCRPLIGKQKQS